MTIPGTDKKYVKADRQVIFSKDPSKWGKELENYINNEIRQGKDVIISTEDGKIHKITKDTAWKMADRTDWDDENYRVKINAASHIDELVESSKYSHNESVGDRSEKRFKADSFDYRKAYFMDYDGEYYSLWISEGVDKSGIRTYSIGKNIRKRNFPGVTGSSSPRRERRSNAGVPLSGTVSQSGSNVNRENSGAENGKEQYEINPNFERNYNDWINRNKPDRESLLVGRTSEPLKEIGVKESKITWDTTKINATLKKHKNIDEDVLRQIPNMLEEPIVILQSKGFDSRIVLFGEIYDKNNVPVLGVLELMPTNRKGELLLDEIKVASTYSKDLRKFSTQNYINSSNILYVEPNVNRTKNWLSANKLQLPLAETNYGPISNVTYPDTIVNRENSGAENGGDRQYAIMTIPGTDKKYVKANEQVIKSKNVDDWENEIINYVNNVVRKGQDIVIPIDNGENIIITGRTSWKLGDKGEYDNYYYLVKGNASGVIDEIVSVSKYSKSKPPMKAHKNNFAKNGFEYRTAYFEDLDGSYYRLKISVGLNSDGKEAYNIGDIKK